MGSTANAGLHSLQSPLSVGDGSQSPQTDGTFRLRSHRSSFSVPQGAAPALPSASSGEASRTPRPRGLGTPGWVKSSQSRSAEEPLLAYLLSHFIRSIMPSGQQGLSGLICRFKAVLVSVDLTLRREKARCMPATQRTKMLTFTQTLQIRISHLHRGAGPARRPRSLTSVWVTSHKGTIYWEVFLPLTSQATSVQSYHTAICSRGLSPVVFCSLGSLCPPCAR